jgi:orotidine-5'-phosphate decarboxylase
MHSFTKKSPERWRGLEQGVQANQNFSSLGAVVGATHPDDIRILRSEMPAQIFLIPGYGFQGGTADDLTDAFYQNGTGAIVNSSRGILFPKGKKTTLEDISAAAEKAQEELFRISFRK